MPQVVLPLPVSRAQAKAMGVARYFTGEACVNGHVRERNTKTGHCYDCMQMRQQHRLKNDPVYLEMSRSWGREAARQRLSDPNYRELVRARDQVGYRTNEQRRAKKSSADRLRNQAEATKARRRELQRLRYQEKLKHDPQHIAARKQRNAEWVKKNAERANAKTALRRAMRKQATPTWLTDADRSQMLEFYVQAQERSKATGIKHEVDHIVPLKHDLVCGLHVPWNLQILTAAQNRAKRNQLPE